MAGVAANVTAFNTVVSYDLWQAYVRKDEPDEYYVRFGRIATVLGIVVAIGTAFIAAGFNSIMDYIQALFSFFNAPLFATFLLAMFWKRATSWGASGGWPRAPWPRSPSTSSTRAARWISARRCRPTSGARWPPLSSTCS
jgi:SSS family solute:Na+ symporter